MSSDLNLDSIDFQSNLRSKPVRNNFTDIQNNFNALRSEFATSVSSTASEITNARDNLGALDDNIHLRSQNGSYINTGGLVTAQGTPDNTIRVSSGNGMIDGIGVSFNSATSATMSAPTTGRLDVVTINSDNTLSIELGNDSADKILPSLASTQRPLAYITQDTANPLTIASGDITEIRRQGCYANGKWFFKIQDAINYISSGEIKINAGNYFEELDLSGKSDIQLTGQKGVNLYRPSATEYAIKSINSGGSETTGIKIKDISLFGNSKAGAIELLKFEYTDKFQLDGITFDGNSSSTATYKDFVINQCDDFYINGIVASGTYNHTNTTNYQFMLSDNADFEKITTQTINTGNGDVECYAMDQDVETTDNVTFNNLTLTGRYIPRTYHFGASTEKQVFDELKDDIPTNGDKMLVNGGLQSLDISYVERTSSTQMIFYGVSQAGGSSGSITVNDSAINSLAGSFAW